MNGSDEHDLVGEVLGDLGDVVIKVGPVDSIVATVRGRAATLVYRGKKEVGGVKGPAWELMLDDALGWRFAAILVGKRHALERARKWLEGTSFEELTASLRHVAWRVTKDE